MRQADRSAILALPVTVLIGGALAWAGSQGGGQAFGLPLFAMAVGSAFLIQWVAFVPAWLRRTEKFYDLTGGLTYVTITALAVWLSPTIDGRSRLLLVLVVVWAGRLSIFLVRRVHRAGKDGRFDELKTSVPRFLLAWTLQGLWVAFTAAAALVAITTTTRKALDAFAAAGFAVWIVGFTIEAVADEQKRRFQAGPANRGRFIRTGWWARSRHPNYFGEIVLWVGVAIIALPVLRGWQWVALASPLFVTLLLTRVSGVPILEQRADQKWGGQPDYEEYKRRTPVLIPKL
jgi:steroid 5-alpha reductase family enzyme